MVYTPVLLAYLSGTTLKCYFSSSLFTFPPVFLFLFFAQYYSIPSLLECEMKTYDTAEEEGGHVGHHTHNLNFGRSFLGCIGANLSANLLSF